MTSRGARTFLERCFEIAAQVCTGGQHSERDSGGGGNSKREQKNRHVEADIFDARQTPRHQAENNP